MTKYETITVEGTAIVKKTIRAITGVTRDGTKYYPWIFKVLQTRNDSVIFSFTDKNKAEYARLRAISDLKRP